MAQQLGQPEAESGAGASSRKPVGPPNPMIGGFSPDPSMCFVDGWFYLVNSTFEYLPGLPIYRSRDLLDWEHIGNVATHEEQIRVAGVDAEAGVFAPTIRHRDGVFYVITTTVPHRGNVVFTATDPAGPWSDGVELPGITGIDPDLCWDDEGRALVTYAGADFSGPEPRMLGILQSEVDLTTGQRLGDPRPQFQGTGLKFPEGPHLIRRGRYWYLMLAEGGTERGHAVSIARGPSPDGPWESCPANPILTRAGREGPIQNTGHADLVEGPDGRWHLVFLGVRTAGVSQRFAPLGRETFHADVDWDDDWPVVGPIEPGPGGGSEDFAVTDSVSADDPGWLTPRRMPTEFTDVRDGRVTLRSAAGDGGLDELDAAFLGRRQRHPAALLLATVRPHADADGVGGIALRSDEWHHVSLLVDASGEVSARARVRGMEQTWSVQVRPAGDPGPVELALRTRTPRGAWGTGGLADAFDLLARVPGGDWTTVTTLDGRYWAMEVGAFMTGRVTGLLATRGVVTFSGVRFLSGDAADAHDLPGVVSPEK